MQHSHLKSNRLEMIGDPMLNKVAARNRKQRKRQASKKRRATLHSRGHDLMDE